MPLRHALPVVLALLLPVRLAGQTDTLRYRFSYASSGPAGPRLTVDVEFRGERGGRTRLLVPTTWAGEGHLGDAISDLEADPGVRIGPEENGERILSHRSGAWIHLRYVLQQDWPGPLRYPLFHRVVIDDRRIAFNQATGLIYPEHAPGATIVLQYQWAGLPAEWRILTSFGAKARVSQPVTWREFSAAFFSAGDFRLVASPGATGGITIEAEGHWNFTDAAFGQMTGALWQAETRFWGERAFDHAFVLLLPIDDASMVAGTAFTGGFFAVSDTATPLDELGRLLAHELFHLWNGQRIGATVDETRYKWFTEGFTDYYADRMFRDVGHYSDAEYRDRVNAELRGYYTSPARGLSRQAVADRYWTDDAVKQYPYLQGYVLALYLQHRLPAWSGSPFDLDSLMVRAYHALGNRNADVSDRLLETLAPRPAGDSLAAAIARYVDRGVMVPADSGALGACSAVRGQRDARAATIVPQYVPVRGVPGCFTLGG